MVSLQRVLWKGAVCYILLSLVGIFSDQEHTLFLYVEYEEMSSIPLRVGLTWVSVNERVRVLCLNSPLYVLPPLPYEVRCL